MVGHVSVDGSPIKRESARQMGREETRVRCLELSPLRTVSRIPHPLSRPVVCLAHPSVLGQGAA
eukprot:2146894-Rhodomonas_salina.1